MRVLGLHTAGHDAGACLFEDGHLIFAIEAERLTRVKHEPLGQISLDHLLSETRVDPQSIDLVALGTTYSQSLMQVGETESVMKKITACATHIETTCKIHGRQLKCLVIAHEACHAALGCHYLEYKTPSLVLTNEGRGAFSRNSVFLQRESCLELLERNPLPWYGSGFGWTAFGYALGFGVSPSVAGTVMGLGGHGKASDAIRSAVLNVEKDIHYRTRPEQEDIMNRFLASEWFDGSFETKANIIATLQEMFNESLLALLRRYCSSMGVRHIALSGGCALNVVTNSCLRENLGLVDLAIPPAPNDAGVALGAAIYAQRFWLGLKPEPFSVYCNGLAEPMEKTISTVKKRGLAFGRLT